MASGNFVAKAASLATLTLQNSMLVLLLRYSRTLPGEPYLATTAVLLCEALKLGASLVLCAHTTGVAFSRLPREIFADRWYLLAVPAVLYTVQNNLQYTAAALLDAATFQVTYQLKILTTALCSVWLLRRRLSNKKWLALFLLTCGVILVQWPSSHSAAAGAAHAPDNAASIASNATAPIAPADDLTRPVDPAPAGAAVEPVTTSAAAAVAATAAVAAEAAWSTRMLGLIVISFACLLSGLAGVYFEKLLKGSSTSLWVRNVQLSLFSLVVAAVGTCSKDGGAILSRGFFQGYTPWTWAAILCQAGGGLLVSLVVKYADNILKGFATSISILVSSVASIYLFDFKLDSMFSLGSALVIYATYLYGQPDRPADGARMPPLPMHRYQPARQDDDDDPSRKRKTTASAFGAGKTIHRGPTWHSVN